MTTIWDAENKASARAIEYLKWAEYGFGTPTYQRAFDRRYDVEIQEIIASDRTKERRKHGERNNQIS